MSDNNTKHFHFIAIGGAAMHNIALALAEQGNKITGSDDEIFQPSLSRLEAQGLLPKTMGWHPDNIIPSIDAIILGMHAKEDNPELLKAQALGLKIYSYPEFIYSQSENKHRVVIAGSHGKTTVTSMVMHVLKCLDRDFDYMVGAKIEGFNTMCKLSESAPVIIIEGDEYLASAIDKVPKFLKYHHHVALVTGIAWDHINVFPSLEVYVRQFDHLADATPKGGIIIYNDEDPLATVICKKERLDVTNIEYAMHANEVINGQTFLIKKNKDRVAVPLFGDHNMSNISAAKTLCQEIGVTENAFYSAISSFKGAASRLELLASNQSSSIYKDFAHAPSKVKATVKAVKKQFGSGRKLLAILELHTYSSLNKDFLPNYSKTMNSADMAMLYVNPDVLKHKGLPAITNEELLNAFQTPNLQIFSTKDDLVNAINSQYTSGSNVLFMTSGNFDGVDFKQLATLLIAKH